MKTNSTTTAFRIGTDPHSQSLEQQRVKARLSSIGLPMQAMRNGTVTRADAYEYLKGGASALAQAAAATGDPQVIDSADVDSLPKPRMGVMDALIKACTGKTPTARANEVVYKLADKIPNVCCCLARLNDLVKKYQNDPSTRVSSTQELVSIAENVRNTATALNKCRTRGYLGQASNDAIRTLKPELEALAHVFQRMERFNIANTPIIPGDPHAEGYLFEGNANRFALLDLCQYSQELCGYVYGPGGTANHPFVIDEGHESSYLPITWKS